MKPGDLVRTNRPDHWVPMYRDPVAPEQEDTPDPVVGRAFWNELGLVVSTIRVSPTGSVPAELALCSFPTTPVLGWVYCTNLVRAE